MKKLKSIHDRGGFLGAPSCGGPALRPDLLGFQLRRNCSGGRKVYIRAQFPPHPLPLFETPGLTGLSSILEPQERTNRKNTLSNEIEKV